MDSQSINMPNHLIGSGEQVNKSVRVPISSHCYYDVDMVWQFKIVSGLSSVVVWCMCGHTTLKEYCHYLITMPGETLCTVWGNDEKQA